MSIVNRLRHSPWVFFLACLAALAIVLVSEGAYWESVQKLDQVSRHRTAQRNIENLIEGVVNAETGTRGFLLTGSREYLVPYEAALRQIDASLQLVDQDKGASQRHAAQLQQLHELISAKLSEMALTIRLVEEGRVKATADIVMSGIGKEKMDELRAIGQSLIAREERNIGQGRIAIYRTLLLSRFGIMLLSASGLLALFLYLRQTTALKRQQREQQRLVQAERDRLETEVGERTAQLVELAQHIQSTREDERSRLARNLHDDLGSLLTSAKLDAARIKSRITSAAPEALPLLAHLVETLNGGIALGRRIIEDLRPSALSNLGLVAALEILSREFSDQSGVQVHCELDAVTLTPEAELTIYRLVQEAITNIAKYAQARQAWLRLRSFDSVVEISVRDDGIGFDPSQRRPSAYGLMGMRYRVEAVGGRLELVSRPGQGAIIRARIPQAAAAMP
ncbi:MAG: CHASE3 domain-containing protein [Burkholderiaceae bacterium]